MGLSNYPAGESLNTFEEPNGQELSIIDAQQRKIEVLNKKFYALNEKNKRLIEKYLRMLEKKPDKSGERWYEYCFELSEGQSISPGCPYKLIFILSRHQNQPVWKS